MVERSQELEESKKERDLMWEKQVKIKVFKWKMT